MIEEPPDGSLVVLDIGYGEFQAIRRSDEVASRVGKPMHRWIGHGFFDMFTWEARLKYAKAVYVIPDSLRQEARREEDEE